MNTVRILVLALAAWVAMGSIGCDPKTKPKASSKSGDTLTRSESAPKAADAKSEAIEDASLQQGEKCPHNALKADCSICDPALREKCRLWCKEHNRYEDRCFECHPELREKGRLYCEEHHLYEDECFLCHPELKKGSAMETPKEVESKAIKATGLLCKEHNVLESECGICHPELLARVQTGGGLKVRLASAQSATKGGLETGKAESDESERGAAFLSRVTYNQNKFAHITSLVPGVTQKVHADFGSQVKKGQVLVEIASPDIARAKSAYLGAQSDLSLKELSYQREKGLSEKNVSSRQEYELAEAEYRKAKNEAAAARQQLANYGVSETDLAELIKTHATSSDFALRAPFAGTIIDRKAVTGEAVNSESPLFALADLSTMWLELSVPSDAGAGLQVGDLAAAVFDAFPGVQFPGKLIWISPGIDEATRTLKARALVRNPKGVLRDGMFGKVRIPTFAAGKRLGLTSEAVQHIEGSDYVFVKLEADLYEIRKVWVEEGSEGKVSVLAGLDPEDQVVLEGSFAMKTEFLKSRLGAGCTGED